MGLCLCRDDAITVLDWFQLPTAALGSAALIIVTAYVVYGLTGFGSSITALPLLVQVIPLRTAVPLILIFDLCVGLLMGLRNRKLIARSEVVRLLPFMLVGMVLGVTLLVKVPERALILLLGTFVLSYSAWSLVMRPEIRPMSSRWAALFGTCGGVS